MVYSDVVPSDIRVLYNHIYEYKKGVRNLVLFTMNEKHLDMAVRRLENQNIPYLLQPLSNKHVVNVYFGNSECLDAVSSFIYKPLNMLTPEQDFILGALLGYNLCEQCKRFCKRKKACGT